jgi:hypothetical protein
VAADLAPAAILQGPPPLADNDSLPRASAVARVELLLSKAVSASHLATELDTLELSIGSPAVRELVAALFHARSRSHSWRYTRPLSLLEHRNAKEHQVARLVRHSQNALELLGLAAMSDLTLAEVDETLVNLLYAQNHGFRWKVTYPLRRILGSRHLERSRWMLRRLHRRLAYERRGLKRAPRPNLLHRAH